MGLMGNEVHIMSKTMADVTEKTKRMIFFFFSVLSISSLGIKINKSINLKSFITLLYMHAYLPFASVLFDIKKNKINK